MKTERRLLTLEVFFVLTICAAGSLAQESGRIFEKALFLEESEGDLDKAIALYEKIVKEHGKEPGIAAKAQLHIGLCYEKLGKTEAVKAYETVISRFPDETGVVTEARGRLAVLRGKEPAGLTMTRLHSSDLYIESQTLSPDGTKLAGIVTDNPMAEGQNLAVYDLNTQKLELITKFSWSKKSHGTYAPVWSPDGKEIVHWVSSWGDPGETSSMLWISTLDGESRVLYRNAEEGGIAPCDWLPDKSAVAALMGKQDGSYHLVAISTADGACRELCPIRRTFKLQNFGMAAASLSADVSPDGRFIAFADGPPDSSRDIYIIAAGGGEPVRLIDHPADDAQPHWSPDGRHLAFASDRHGSWALWGVAVNEAKTAGSAFMILEGMEDSDLVSWTKRGLLSRTSLSFNEIYITEIDPRSHAVLEKPHILDLPKTEHNLHPWWSPDGKYLSFISYPRSFQSSDRFLSIMPSGGGTIRKFKYDSSIRPVGGTVRWMPDGSGMGLIDWDSEKHLYFSRLDLGTGQWTRRQIPAEGFSAGRGFAFTWGDDGKAFIYIRKDENDSASVLVLRDLESGNERSLYRIRQTESLGWSFKASHDHNRLALDDDGKTIIFDLKTGQTERFEYGGKKHLFSPSWSPDGKYLVAKGEPEGGGDHTELYIISLEDGTFKNLNIHRYLPPGSQIVSSPEWSPDGRKIAIATWTGKSEANLITNVIPEK